MGWDVAVFGELTFPSERMEKWKGEACDPNAFHDWTHDFARDAGTAAKVRDVISRLGKLDPALGFVEIEVEDGEGRLRIRGHLTEDAYWDENRVLASLFRSAAPFDGRGAITFVGFETIDFGYRFDVAKGASTMVVMDETMRRTRRQRWQPSSAGSRRASQRSRRSRPACPRRRGSMKRLRSPSWRMRPLGTGTPTTLSSPSRWKRSLS
jgi:hypothetical protein